MSIAPALPANILWFLPTHGDGRYLGTTKGGRQSISLTCARSRRPPIELGYFGVLLPTGRSCEDSWIVASALAPLTRRLRYLVAVRPGPAVAERRGADDRDAGPDLGGSAAGQCRHRR